MVHVATAAAHAAWCFCRGPCVTLPRGGMRQPHPRPLEVCHPSLRAVNESSLARMLISMWRLPALGVLFDLDGVLVDSTECVRRAWYEWAARHGVDGRATYPLGLGRTTLDHLRLAAPELATTAHAGAVAALEDAYVEAVTAQPGAVTALAALAAAGLPWGVVTSCPRPAALDRLDAAGLKAPAVLVSADDVARPKPAPDGYRAGCARLGVPPSRVVVFEDAPAGIEAARTAGAAAVAVGVPADGLPWIADLSAVTFVPDAASGGVDVVSGHR
ncbi:HAD-IA family hydrolase [Micromonospora sp. CPCC 206061]|uniref:HAD-IA family hydrolase n=1 Tax=Micromonospora sp. CPCC 206061 TaxID=3122410 RepID=UPI002FF41DB0